MFYFFTSENGLETVLQSVLEIRPQSPLRHQLSTCPVLRLLLQVPAEVRTLPNYLQGHRVRPTARGNGRLLQAHSASAFEVPENCPFPDSATLPLDQPAKTRVGARAPKEDRCP